MPTAVVVDVVSAVALFDTIISGDLVLVIVYIFNVAVAAVLEKFLLFYSSFAVVATA